MIKLRFLLKNWFFSTQIDFIKSSSWKKSPRPKFTIQFHFEEKCLLWKILERVAACQAKHVIDKTKGKEKIRWEAWKIFSWFSLNHAVYAINFKLEFFNSSTRFAKYDVRYVAKFLSSLQIFRKKTNLYGYNDTKKNWWIMEKLIILSTNYYDVWR